MLFIKGFMETYEEFKGKPIFIVGEGTAGHFVPLFAKAMK